MKILPTKYSLVWWFLFGQSTKDDKAPYARRARFLAAHVAFTLGYFLPLPPYYVEG